MAPRATSPADAVELTQMAKAWGSRMSREAVLRSDKKPVIQENRGTGDG